MYILTNIVYNLYFHPLRHFPGPRTHAATSLAWGFSMLRGTLPLDIHAHHETYGPVFRVRPNELAFADAPAWQDVYGHKVLGKKAGLAPGAKELPKHLLFYKSYPGQPDTIVTADYELHAKWRRTMATGFSDKSLRAQEPLVTRYVDLLIARLRERSGEALDIVQWYNWTTFDVIGDLAFGESFGCLENARYHPFVSIICSSVKQASRLIFLRYMGLQTLSLALLFALMRKAFKLRGYGTKTLEKRLASGSERSDLIQPLIESSEKGEIPFGSLGAMASSLLVAGSETTASTMSGVTWLLLANPEKLAKLAAEVRGAFSDESEIDFTSTQGLVYLTACLNEGLRRYPAIAGGLPRVVPKGGALISGNYVPEGVSSRVQSPLQGSSVIC
ncbi:cytochrome P450 [Candidatus Bathyarchaeota archaeon]|nr:cytochrome P450 [Candidatus Bathyarchaeota archaeon]